MVAVASMTMTNSDFLAEVYQDLAPGTHGWVCSFRQDPASQDPGKWGGRPYKGLPQQAALIDRAHDDNTYFCTSVLAATGDGEIVRRKDAFVRLAVLVLDDVQLSDVQGLSYAIQTSPGKHQIGIFLDGDDADAQDRQLVDRVMSALAARGRSNDASGNACVRYVRLPVGSNTKPRAAGTWQVQLEVWQPRLRWSLADACSAVGIDLDALRIAAALPKPSSSHTAGNHAGEMITGLTAAPSERIYHDSITRLAASLVSGGMFPGAAVDFLYSLMDQVRPSGPAEEVARWESRRAEIPRAVRSAEKFAPEERQPHQITVNLAKAEEPEPVQQGDLQPMDWGALEHETPEPTQWRLDGWLPEGTVTLLSANGGVGKSNLSLQLGVALAHGMSLFEVDTKPSRVLVLSGEDEARTVHFRVANICQDMQVPMASLAGKMIVYDLTQADCVLWRDGGPTERMQWLADQAVRLRAEVIVIDNASDVFAANENDRTEVRGFMRSLNLIAHHTRAAVLLLAHVDKASVRAGAGLDSNSTFSGSTAWNNSARSRWAMVREPEGVLLKHEKCNLGPLQDEIRLEFDAQTKTFKRFGTVPGAKAARQLVRSQHRVAILRLLHDAVQAGGRLSMSAQANNNAWRLLHEAEGFPAQLARADFFGLLNDLMRDGLIEEAEYTTPSRGKAKRLVLTEVGNLRVAQGSGAAAMWRRGVDDE
jgi:archaellum biogenesis ATPase FlaH